MIMQHNDCGDDRSSFIGPFLINKANKNKGTMEGYYKTNSFAIY